MCIIHYYPWVPKFNTGWMPKFVVVKNHGVSNVQRIPEPKGRLLGLESGEAT